MNERHFLDLAAHLMSLPTAAFHEHFVAAAVKEFVAARSAIELTSDPFGNLLLLYDGSPAGAPGDEYLVATAHMDHPGLGFISRISKDRFLFEKLGGVDAELATGSAVCIYDLNRDADQKPIKGKVCAFVPGVDERPSAFEVKVGTSAADAIGPGSFAMWDLPPFAKKGRKLHGRACDDLAGAAVGLAFMDELVRTRSPVRAGLLLTRAEEVGFGGMLAAKDHLLDTDALYVNVECSSSKAGAQLGDGPVIRVGDLWWIFDPAVTGGMVALANQLAAADPSFRFQRKLMDGGICEATVLVNASLRTGAVALPLGNYHNAGKKRLKAEVVHLDDALCLVDLLFHLATAAGGVDNALREATWNLDERLAKRRKQFTRRLRETANGEEIPWNR